jgi:glutamate-1-semialdehyde 2,1-aminomutase
VSWIVDRVRSVPEVDLVVASVPLSDDVVLSELFRRSGVDCVYYGPERNVLLRFCLAATLSGADVVVRVTGDCPLFSPVAASEVIKRYVNDDQSRRFWSNDTTCSGWPDGTDVEVFPLGLLNEAHLHRDTTERDREHVTSWMRRTLGPSVGIHTRQEDHLSKLKLSIDTPDDLARVQKFYEDGLYPPEWILS